MAVADYALTQRQQECVDYRGTDLLIRGVPGSGKTVVLLRRARKLAEEADQDGSVRVYTFNKTLAKYARELVIGAPGVEVIHFHGWASSAMKKLGKYPSIVQDRSLAIKTAIEVAKQESSSRVLSSEIGFFSQEISWIKGQMITDLKTYEVADRRGRGAALKTPERRAVWCVYEAYQADLKRKGQMDWDDFAPTLIHLVEHRAESLPAGVACDHILVDEAQDLEASQLRLLKMVARKTLTVAADEAQKIYPTSFAWRDVGVNVLGSGSKRLSTSFRSTRQIVELAASLRRHDSPTVQGEPVEFEVPNIDGPIPTLFAAESNLAEEQAVLELLRSLTKTWPERTIGLLARQWRTLFRFRHLLDEASLQHELIKDADGSITTPGIKVTTFHSAKGLEFDFVILVRVNDGIIPPECPAGTTPEDVDELTALERRLLYVSMTRAKFALYLSLSAIPSRFLDEMDPSLYVQRRVRT